MSTLSVTIDERLRLVTAVLAASHWPAAEQKQQAHAVHPQAKQVRHFLKPFQAHPAVGWMNRALDTGRPLADLFGLALGGTWPNFTPDKDLAGEAESREWLKLLADFARETAVASQFWPQHAPAWSAAEQALALIIAGTGLLDSLAQLREGSAKTAVSLMPNLVFPALTPVVVPTAEALTLLLPPPKAVGESPPWPFDEDPGWVVATVVEELSPHLLATELAQLAVAERPLAIHLAVAHCLAQLLDDFEAQAYLLRARIEHNLPQLPDLFARLQAEVGAGYGRPLTNLFTKK